MAREGLQDAGATARSKKSMNYELANELRDAGFPQEGEGRKIGRPDALYWRGAERAYAPTLSELIEACGSGFHQLRRADFAPFVAIGLTCSGTGQTPDEAVARLWLALRSAKPV